MKLDRSTVESLGGEEALAERVAAFALALERHRFTVGEAAPAEAPIVEAIARAGGMRAVEIVEPPVPPPAKREIAALDFRRRFKPEELAAITLAASRGLEEGDARIQVWLDDVNAARAIDLDDPVVSMGLAALVGLGLLEEKRAAAILG
jgi:hypothetical protein